jgi:hypothetical protein
LALIFGVVYHVLPIKHGGADIDQHQSRKTFQAAVEGRSRLGENGLKAQRPKSRLNARAEHYVIF